MTVSDVAIVIVGVSLLVFLAVQFIYDYVDYNVQRRKWEAAKVSREEFDAIHETLRRIQATPDNDRLPAFGNDESLPFAEEIPDDPKANVQLRPEPR